MIVALWAICLLAAFSVILNFQVRQRLVLIYRLDERDKLYSIAEAGIKKAIVELKKEPIKSYDALNDAWANNAAAFKEIFVGDGKAEVSYSRLDETTGVWEARYGLADEESKININKMDAKVLEKLFHAALGYDEMAAQELAASIVDWRDPDSELSIPIGSAEDSSYRSTVRPYEAKDANYEILEELLLVNAMDYDIFEKLRDYITIYGSGKVNVNTASKTVLVSLGLSGDIADKILSFRAGEDKLSGTVDDNIFEATSSIVPKLSQYSSLSDSEVALLSTVVDSFLAVNSNCFTIRSVAKLNYKKNTAGLVSVVDRTGKILYWQKL